MIAYEETLDAHRAEIAALEARARALRQAWVSAYGGYETNQTEADRLEEEARGLRVSLPEITRITFGVDGDDEVYTEGEEPDDDDDCG
ncbi:MAG: hypothetical protein ACT4O5_08200 [Gammaproteobacteria bacterium]